MVAYLDCGVGGEAARRAGYSAKNSRSVACELLKKPKVQERLREIREAAESTKIASHAEVCERLTSIVRAEKDDSPLQPANRSTRIAAAALLSKLRGYIPPEEHKVKGKIVREIRFVRPKSGSA